VAAKKLGPAGWSSKLMTEALAETASDAANIAMLARDFMVIRPS
jgi:hypothetical protein